MHLAEAPIGLSLFAPSLTIHVTPDILHATLCALHLTIHVTPDNDILHVTWCMWYLTCVHLAPAPICLPLFALSYHTSQLLLVCHSLLCIWLCILLPPISFHCTSIPPIFTSFHLLTPYFMLHVATTQLIFAIVLLPFWRRKNTPFNFPFPPNSNA